MLRKLTSPKARAAPASSKKEISELKEAASPDEVRQKPSPEELKLDLNALAAGAEETSLEAESEPAAPPAERRRTLARSPRVRKNLVDDGADPEPPASNEDAPSDHRQPLARSPRVRKNLLDDDGGAGEAATGSAQSSPKKGGGLKALRSSDAKSAKAGDGSDEDAAKKPRGAKLKKVGKEKSKRKDKEKAGKAEAKALDRHDEEKSGAESQHEGTGDDAKQPATSVALSPLRRRKPATESVEPDRLGGKLGGKQRLKLRDLPPANQPEVHVIGEITSGEGFGSGGFACKWGVEFGSAWHHVAGDQLGQTQIDYPASGHPVVWSHPIDLHFATTSFHGWPKLLLQVWHVDAHMTANVVGYGFVNLPFAAGEHELTASLWRPKGSAKEELAATLLGRTPELVSDDVVFNAAWADRCRLQTVATGKVHLHVGLVLRNFHVSNLQM